MSLNYALQACECAIASGWVLTTSSTFVVRRPQQPATCYDVDHRHDVRRPVSHARHYADEMSYSRRSPSLRWISLWATTTVAVECPTDLFVASYWLEPSSSRFSVILLIFSRADHSTLQVLTTFYVVFISTFYWRLASKAFQLIRHPADWSTAGTSYASVNSDARSIRFLKIFEYAAKQAYKQLQCNKAKLSEPASKGLRQSQPIKRIH